MPSIFNIKRRREKKRKDNVNYKNEIYFAKKEEIKESESECVYMDVDDDES